MLSQSDALKIRPLGNRLLVKRLPLPEDSIGGIRVIGRDYPTLGRVVKTGWAEHPSYNLFGQLVGSMMGLQCQWSIDPHTFEYKLIAEDILLLNYTDLNYIVLHKAYACGDRLIIDPMHDIANYLSERTILHVAEKYTSRWQMGHVVSSGPGSLSRKNSFIPNNAVVGDTVVYQRHLASDAKLSDKDYHIIRNDDCVAVLERT